MALKFLFVLSSLLSLLACSRNSLEDFKEEAKGITRTISETLRQIHTREELIKQAPRLKKLFNDLTDIIIASNEFQKKHPKEDRPALNAEDRLQSDILREELNRIYRLEGGREIIEKTQEEALHRLYQHLGR